MTDRWERLTDLYHAAVALPEDERASLLTEACVDDPALQADVLRLVAAHDRASQSVTAPIAPHPGPERVSIAPPAAAGEPIDAFADGRRLSIAERLELFLQVCNAVAYARRRGVAYGPLEPANILVTHGGVPELPDISLAEHQTTAADEIHSLGVLLDVLLGSDASTGPRRSLRGDLDTIVRTALRQDARRRYGSVEEMADDARRALDSLTARVRPDNRRARPSADAKRNRGAVLAWVAAGIAVAALGVKAAPLLTERAAPVAIMPPAEIPNPRDRVLVADFADHAGDPQLAATLSDAFRTALGESPSVVILPARRQRVDAEVTGSIDSVGRGYSITVQVRRRAQGDSTPTLLETATDSADVMRALGLLSERLREQLGEPATSISATPRLNEVTTPSLPALRAYANGARAISSGDRARGLRLLRTAVGLDTGFATAHRLMSLTYAEMGDRQRAADALDHAIANDARLPFYTRNHTVANHAMTALAHYPAAIDAYNRILTRYPNDMRALEGLALAHAARREYAVQESLLVRAIAVDSGVPLLFTRLALAQVNQGKYGAARRTLDWVEQRLPGMRGTLAALSIAASQLDWESAEREASARLSQDSSDADAALDRLETLASIRMTQGRLAEAERDLRRVVASGTRSDVASRALTGAVRLAYLELRYRRAPAAALATVNSALRRYPLARMAESDRPYDEVARLFADAGQPARARELIAESARTRLGRRRPTDANRRWTIGAIATAEGRAWESEIEIHGAAETHPCPICVLPDLARAYEVAGKPDSAIATYERYLKTPWQRRFDTDAIELGFAMERLGALYQQQRDGTRAGELYTELLQLWRGADPELQPLIADVRRRLEQTTTGIASR